MAVPYRAWLTAAVLSLLIAAPAGCGDAVNKGTASTSSGSGAGSGSGGSGAGGGSGGTPQAGPLSIMTWNIERFPKQSDTVGRVRDIILQQQPDVLAIQEIDDPAAFDDLVQLLPDYDGVINNDEGGDLRLGMLYKRDRVQLSEVATLYNGNWYPFPRPPLKARVIADGGAYDFILVSVHLKATLDAESQDRRLEACLTLDTWVENQIANGVDTEYIIVGDYNDELTDPPADNVFNVFLDKPESYTFLTQPAALDNDYTFVPFQSMIDHVLVTNDMLDDYGAGFTNILPFDVSIADYDEVSDHRPVFVRLVKE